MQLPYNCYGSGLTKAAAMVCVMGLCVKALLSAHVIYMYSDECMLAINTFIMVYDVASKLENIV